MTSDEIKDYKDGIISAIKTTVLGREGLLPIGAMRNDPLLVARKMIEDGELVELPHIPGAAGTRYGLKEEHYPLTYGEFLEYRGSKASETMSYKEFKLQKV